MRCVRRRDHRLPTRSPLADTTHRTLLLDRAVSDPKIFDAIEIVVTALGKLGGIAKSALPTLHEAQRRTYTWYTAKVQCTREVRVLIHEAIQAIE